MKTIRMHHNSCLVMKDGKRVEPGEVIAVDQALAEQLVPNSADYADEMKHEKEGE